MDLLKIITLHHSVTISRLCEDPSTGSGTRWPAVRNAANGDVGKQSQAWDRHAKPADLLAKTNSNDYIQPCWFFSKLFMSNNRAIIQPH